jgi:predicted nucleotidyltransferase
MTLTREQLDKYRETADARMAEEARRASRRRETAWRRAREAARILKDQFGATRVCAFGSILRPESFSLWSDLDIAAWGLTPRNWLKASAAIRALSDEIELNLVDTDTCSDSLLRVIQRDGTTL